MPMMLFDLKIYIREFSQESERPKFSQILGHSLGSSQMKMLFVLHSQYRELSISRILGCKSNSIKVTPTS